MKQRYLWLFLAAAMCAVVAGAAAQEQAPSSVAPEPRFPNADRREALARAFPEIDGLFRAFASQSRVPGIAWGVLVDGALVHSGTAGQRETRTGSPVTLDTVFRIASMTKSFTAVAILRLRDEGRLSLDDPAERYVPELAGLKCPDHRFAPHHHPSPAVARGRVSRRQSVGRPAARRDG